MKSLESIQLLKKKMSESIIGQAINAGWRNYRIGNVEPLFENIRHDARFDQRIEHVKGMVDKVRKQIYASE